MPWTRGIIGDDQPAFIYQRYSMNDYTGLRLAERFGVPFVLEYNGSEVWIARNWGNPYKYERQALDVEMVDLTRADLIVVVSVPMRDELVRRGIDAKQILVNPNSVDGPVLAGCGWNAASRTARPR